MIDNETMNDQLVDNGDGTICIATKVTRQFAYKLQRLCEQRGMTVYQLLRNAADSIVRYTDDRHNLDPQLEQLMMMFEHLKGWKDNFNLADPTADPEIVEAVYVEGDKRRKGNRVVMVETPFFGDWQATYNVQVIMEKMMELLVPDIYRQLRQMGLSLGTQSVLESLQKLVIEYQDEESRKQFTDEFEDIRTEFGQKPHEGGPYKRKMHKSVESMEQDLSFRPFGGEW